MTVLIIIILKHQNTWISGILRRHATIKHQHIYKEKRKPCYETFMKLYMILIRENDQSYEWWGCCLFIILRSHFKACEYMKEGQISYLYLFVCDQSNHYYDCCDGFSIELDTNQLNPFCRIIFELKEKSFDLKNDHFRIGIVLLSYLFLPGKWGEMVCLELYQIGVRAYAFFCLLCQGQERQREGWS